MLSLAHAQNVSADMRSVSPAAASKRAVYISDSQLHMNHRDLGETPNMVLSKGAVWQTHWYIGAIPCLSDSHLKQRHPHVPFSLYIPPHRSSQCHSESRHKRTQIKLCAWQLRVRQKDMGWESWRQKQSEKEREREGLRKKMKESMREGWREKIKIVQLWYSSMYMYWDPL